MRTLSCFVIKCLWNQNFMLIECRIWCIVELKEKWNVFPNICCKIFGFVLYSIKIFPFSIRIQKKPKAFEISPKFTHFAIQFFLLIRIRVGQGQPDIIRKPEIINWMTSSGWVSSWSGNFTILWFNSKENWPGVDQEVNLIVFGQITWLRFKLNFTWTWTEISGQIVFHQGPVLVHRNNAVYW